jgi:glycosyltransferase involved in cell wall biosynthesis
MPEVSVIIPAYNSEKHIQEALESVFAQTFRDFEVVVVNDGSTDGTEQKLEKFRGCIRYFCQENRGQSAARRQGLRQAGGELIAFLDSDDLWLPMKLEKQVLFAQARREYGIVSTDVLTFNENGVVSPTLKRTYSISSGWVVEKLLFGNWIPPSAALVRRGCFDVVRDFDAPPPEHGEDWLMWMQIASRYRVYFIDEVLVKRRLHPESVSSGNSEVAMRHFFRNLDIMRNHIPQLRARPDLVDECAFRICCKHGVYHLHALELPLARTYFRKAVGFKDHSLRAWTLLFVSFSPAWMARVVKGAFKNAKKLAGRLLDRYRRSRLGTQRA